MIWGQRLRRGGEVRPPRLGGRCHTFGIGQRDGPVRIEWAMEESFPIITRRAKAHGSIRWPAHLTSPRREASPGRVMHTAMYGRAHGPQTDLSCAAPGPAAQGACQPTRGDGGRADSAGSRSGAHGTRGSSRAQDGSMGRADAILPSTTTHEPASDWPYLDSRRSLRPAAPSLIAISWCTRPISPTGRNNAKRSTHWTRSRMGRGLLSTQVLGEFFRVVTERIRQPLSRTEARHGWPACSSPDQCCRSRRR